MVTLPTLEPSFRTSVSYRATTSNPRRPRPPVVGQGPAQVAGPDDGNPPPLGDAELLTDSRHQLANRISDATDPVEVEMGEVASNVGRVGPGRHCQLLRADHIPG